ncbi:MAG TPA: adenine phosphoribosyltransferase [Candidatus Polarisedimenticolia bacterium]|nr:adenine phosphoribosyltransferase [Candidatus Polarisedimenticolia bacterium]
MTTKDSDLGLRKYIRDVPDFPKQGIVFKDITPLLMDKEALKRAMTALAGRFDRSGIAKVVGIESRGYIFAPAIAVSLDAGFVPVRKPGKLPWKRVTEEYTLEYGTDRLEIHEDAIRPGERVLIVDDLLATGGTASATRRLIERLQGHVVGAGFLVELTFLEGRARLPGIDVVSLIAY